MDQQRQPASPAPRAGSRSFSFRSDKSAGSSGKPNIDKLTESPREKERRDSIWKADSKANPNAAMTEAQPGEINLLEKATIEPLRDRQHKDTKGNVITDPDLANPTRYRLERPLETIRSFEKAIESGYKRRTMMRGETYNEGNASQYASRRSSYVGGEYLKQLRDRMNVGTSQAGYDSNRQSQMGAAGGYYGSPRRDYDNSQQSYASPRPTRYGQRMQSDPAVFRSNGIYPPQPPQHTYQQSYDTAATNGSDSTGPWANSTDPSSDNSSAERVYPGRQQQQQQQQASISEETGYPQNSYAQQNAYTPQNAYSSPSTAYADQAPAPPQQQRRPIQLGDIPPPLPAKGLPATPRPVPERRKSRLSRLFGKKD